MLGLDGTLAMGQVGSLFQLTPQSTMQLSIRFLLLLSFQICFRKHNYAKNVKRKTERANITPDAVLQAAREVRMENRSIRVSQGILESRFAH
jgi:hypothetical protein